MGDAIYLWDGTILFDNGDIAMHEDCCCDLICECCNGAFGGFEVRVAGVTNGTCSDCAEVNDDYCIEALPDPCSGESDFPEKDTCVQALLGIRTTYDITDNGDGTCRLTIDVYFRFTTGRVTGYLDFDQGDDCDTISGVMTITDDDGDLASCKWAAATLEVLGTCTP